MLWALVLIGHLYSFEKHTDSPSRFCWPTKPKHLTVEPLSCLTPRQLPVACRMSGVQIFSVL